MTTENATEQTIDIGLARDDNDLEQILALQKRNLAFTEDGFVTVVHTLDILRTFHRAMPGVVARHHGEVIAYALSMPHEAAGLIPVLAPMFARARELSVLKDKRWYAMGQVCVDQAWRGRGLFDSLYAGHRRHFGDRFDWLVTEISVRNPRSLKAHARVGFIEIDHFRDAVDEWSVVGLPFS